jgi:plastocyanin
MNRNTLIGVIVAAVLLIGIGALVLANGSGNNSSTTPQTTGSTTQNTQHNSQSSNKSTSTPVNNVAIDNFAFSPASITVKKGTTVTWTNKDSAAHTVTENDDQKGPDSGDLAQGKTYSFTFDTVGTFKYHCTIHPDMTGTVTVTE